MADERSRVHHGNALDQLPMLLRRPGVEPFVKERDIERAGSKASEMGHGSSWRAILQAAPPDLQRPRQPWFTTMVFEAENSYSASKPFSRPWPERLTPLASASSSNGMTDSTGPN